MKKPRLVNKVVPHKDLCAEVEKWCAELLEKSPARCRATSLAIAGTAPGTPLACRRPSGAQAANNFTLRSV